MPIQVKSLKSQSSACQKCNGRCWKGPENNAETQKAAMKMFGFIPNNCVNGEGGVIHCPYSN